MEILITNDDGYQAQGIRELAGIMKDFGNVTVIAPKEHQSGMGMAVSLGDKHIEYSETESPVEGVKWAWLSATPATCVKYALNFLEKKPDVVISGINHGSNAAVASCYSGTLGAVAEAVLNGVPGIGVSINTLSPEADFSAVKAMFPHIFEMLTANWPSKFGTYYNVNFPLLPKEQIRGMKFTSMGICRWIREFVANEDGSYRMKGDIEDGKDNRETADHHLMIQGYVTITPHRLDSTDYEELKRLEDLNLM